MVYDWEDKEQLCYQMYIEEKKSLEEIMDFMKVNHQFAPRYVELIPQATQTAQRTLPYPPRRTHIFLIINITIAT